MGPTSSTARPPDNADPGWAQSPPVCGFGPSCLMWPRWMAQDLPALCSTTLYTHLYWDTCSNTICAFLDYVTIQCGLEDLQQECTMAVAGHHPT